MAPLLPQHSQQLLPPRPRLPLLLYTASIVLCLLLFYMSAAHCQFGRCNGSFFTDSNKMYEMFQYFPIIVSPFVASVSLLWLVVKVFYPKSICAIVYNFLVGWEMPCAVLCSLLAGISAVIIIHYSFDYLHERWSQPWTLAAADALLLGAVHAVLAFALQ